MSCAHARTSEPSKVIHHTHDRATEQKPMCAMICSVHGDCGTRPHPTLALAARRASLGQAHTDLALIPCRSRTPAGEFKRQFSVRTAWLGIGSGPGSGSGCRVRVGIGSGLEIVLGLGSSWLAALPTVAAMWAGFGLGGRVGAWRGEEREGGVGRGISRREAARLRACGSVRGAGRGAPAVPSH